MFATSSDEADRMVDAVTTCLQEVGLALNELKPKIITTHEAKIQQGLEMEILDATKAHKWQGC